MRTFYDYNPITVTAYFLCVTLTAMFSMNPLILLPSLVFSIASFLMTAKSRLRDHVFAAGLFLVLSLINPLLSHNGQTVLFVMNDNPITLEALIRGVFSAMMLIAVLYWFRAYTAIMTSDKLLYVFGALSPKLSLILSMSLRMVPLFRQRFRAVENTQKALGIYKNENIIDTLRGKARVFSILITWGLEDGIVTADSMEARGYGTHRRTHFSLFRWHGSDIAVLVISLILCAFTLWELSRCGFDYYPALMLRGTWDAVCACILYSALCALPIILNLKEAVRWNICLSKT